MTSFHFWQNTNSDLKWNAILISPKLVSTRPWLCYLCILQLVGLNADKAHVVCGWFRSGLLWSSKVPSVSFLNMYLLENLGNVKAFNSSILDFVDVSVWKNMFLYPLWFCKPRVRSQPRTDLGSQGAEHASQGVCAPVTSSRQQRREAWPALSLWASDFIHCRSRKWNRLEMVAFLDLL